MPGPLDYGGPADFLFNAGLYAKYNISPADAAHLFHSASSVDGHCPYCHEQTVFRCTTSLSQTQLEALRSGTLSNRVRIQCSRSTAHEIWFELKMIRFVLQKVGQFPSLADIANDDARVYSGVLDRADAREFSRAIGLATHGVGIGSFVYLRRIFERLVATRFQELKHIEGWADADFNGLRMDEKIQFLKGHLPEFLIRNRRIYGILSLGIHELDEDQCLAFFPVLRQSIVVILEEDKRKREDIARQQALEHAIAQFAPERPGGSEQKMPPSS